MRSALAAAVLGLGCGDPDCRFEPPDPEVLGECDAILGWYHDRGRCHNLSGCSCEPPDCAVPFASEEECVATCGGG